MPERIMIFIDGSNLYLAIQGQFNRKDLDIGKLANKLTNGRMLIRTYYYNAPLNAAEDPIGAREQQKFLSALGWIPMLETRMGKLLRRELKYSCPDCSKEIVLRTHVQKGVDTRIAVDLVTLAVRDRYDTAILVSGDADMVEPIRFIKEYNNKRIENAFTIKSWAPELRAEADIKTILDQDFLNSCWR